MGFGDGHARIRLRRPQYPAGLRRSEEDPQECVHRMRLDLRPRLPAGQREFGDPEQTRELSLRQAELLAFLPDLVRREQAGLDTKGLAEPFIRLVIQVVCAAVPAFQDDQMGIEIEYRRPSCSSSVS